MAYSTKRFSKKERAQISQVTARWMEIESELHSGYTHFDLEKDLGHIRRSCPMDYERLLQAAKVSFINDIQGIRQNIDREKHALKNGFIPEHSLMSFAKVRLLSLPERLAKNIKERQKVIGVPNYVLAKAIGSTESAINQTLHKMSHGDYNYLMSLKRLEMIANALETSISSLIDDKE